MPIFLLAIAFDWIGALLAFFVLKPLRVRWVSTHAAATAIRSK
jgi:Sec-independent protein secretion pathway component TatC